MSDIEKVLGLDLGTNSIGFAIRDLSVVGEGEEVAAKAIEKTGVVVFPDAVITDDKGVEHSSAAARTDNRAKRRRNERRRIRKFELLDLLIKHKMVPLTQQELEDYKKKGKYPTHNKAFVSWLKLDFDGSGKPNLTSPYPVSEQVKAILGENYAATLASPYQLRALAIENPDAVTDLMLGRIAYHFIQRRGYQSNRKDLQDNNSQDSDLEEIEKKPKKTAKSKDEGAEDKKAETKKVLGAIKAYDEVLKTEGLTPGQEIAQRLINWISQDGTPARARNRLGATNKFGRTQLRAEWRAIISARGANPDEKPWSTIEDVIFRNRPLKSQKKNIGRCTLEPSKFRMPVSHPVYEYFRIWQVVNNVKYIVKEGDGVAIESGDKLSELTVEQKNNLAQIMIVASNFKGDFLSGKVKESLGLKGQKSKTVLINYDSKTSIAGSPFLAKCLDVLGKERTEAMYDLALRRLEIAEQQVSGEGASKIEGWEEVNHNQVDLFLLWQWLFEAETEEDEIRLYARLEARLGLDQTQSRKLWKSIKDGYAMLSLKAALNILKMMELGYRYDQAALFAKLPKLIGYKLWQTKGEMLLKELERQLQEAVTHNKAIMLANDWLQSYNANVDFENGVLGSRYDPSQLDIEVEREIERIAKNGYMKLSPEEAHEVIARAKSLIASKLSIGTRNQPYPSDPKAKPRQQSIHTFGLYDRKSPFDEVVEFVQSKTEHTVAKIKATLYNHSEVETSFKKLKNQGDNELPSPITNSLRNPVVLRALNQLRRLINHLIRTNAIDPFTTAIQLELSRDLNSSNMRAAIKKWQRDQEDEREKARKEINTHYNTHNPGQQANDTDILKYRLWLEQGKRCIYTDDSISICDLLSGAKYDIEHIIPQSRYPDSEMENLAICQSAFNRQIKRATFVADLSMFGEIKPRLKVYEESIAKYKDEVARYNWTVKKASTKEIKDAAIVKRHVAQMYLNYYLDKIKAFTTPEANFKGGFRKRQARDTDMINKYAVKFLKQQFEMVKGSKGTVTALVRKAWGLQEDAQKKDRSTHEHHAVDAIMQTLLFQKGGEKGPYRLLTELGRGNGALYQRYKNLLEKAESGDYLKKALLNLVGSKDFTPFGLTKAQMLKVIHEKTDNILIYHAPVSSPLKQTKKLLKGNGIPRDEKGKKLPGKFYQTGVGIRAQLHKDTWYGYIRIKNSDGTYSDAFRETVVVKNIDQKSIDRIVDPKLREIAQSHGESYFKTNDYFVIPPKVGTLASTKDQRVYKVKIFSSQKEPLKIKGHQNPLGSNHSVPEEYKKLKHVLYAKNDTNFLIEVQPDKKGQRLLPISSFDLSKQDVKFKSVLNKSMMVIFYENHPDEIDFESLPDLEQRLFIIRAIESDGRITFLRASEAIDQTEFGRGANKFKRSDNPKKLRVARSNWSFIPIDDRALIMHPDGSIDKGPEFDNWKPA